MGAPDDLLDWMYRKRITLIRRGVVLVIFVLLNSMLFGMLSFGRHPLLRFILLPNASCRYIENAPTYCYYYSLQQWLAGGFSSFYLELLIPMLVLGVLIIAFGRGWCAWACPFGLTQEFISSVREFLRIPHYQLSYKGVAFLDQFKYAILFFTLLVALAVGIPHLGLPPNLNIPYVGTLSLTLPFCQICPAQGFFTLLQVFLYFQDFNILYVDKVFSISIWMVAMLLLFFVGSFVIRMFWCRLCPMGAVMALFNKHSLFWLRKDPSRCTKCRICLRVCPQDYHAVYEEMEMENITGGECTLCGRCVESCPEKGALSFNILNFTIYKSKPKR